MILVTDKISINELKEMSDKMFGNLVKAVVDVKKRLLVVDADLHSDQESFLLQKGSKQENLWGINLYPQLPENNLIEFDSMINLKPSLGNNSRSVDSIEIQNKILEIVRSKITK